MEEFALREFSILVHFFSFLLFLFFPKPSKLPIFSPRPFPGSRHQQNHASELPFQILFLHIMAVFHLPPFSRLPSHLQTAHFCGLFNAEFLDMAIPATCWPFQSFAPFDNKPCGDTETLPCQYGPLERRQLPGGQTCHPAFNHRASSFGLGRRENGALVEDGDELDAGPNELG